MEEGNGVANKTLADDEMKRKEFSSNLEKVIREINEKVSEEDYNKVIAFLKFYISPTINDLTEQQIIDLEDCINNFKSKIDKNKHEDAIRYCNWLNTKLDINLIANNQEKLRQKDKDKFHPIRPRRGEIYLAELGENIGREISQQHLVMIIQNNKGNLYANTVVCVPISSSGTLYPTHERILQEDIKQGRLDKLPSKAKTEQIHYLDKARLIHKVAELQPDIVDRIGKRVKKNLDIK